MIKNIFIIGSTAHSLINFRYELIKKLQNNHLVFAVSKDKDINVEKKLKKINVKHLNYGSKIKYMEELFSFINLIKILKNIDKKIKVISYTMRANLFVGLANLLNSKIEHYPMITGLGGIFLSKDENLYRYFLYKFFFFILKISFLKSKKIIFKNKNNKIFFEKILKKKSVVINGSGVDCSLFNNSFFPKKITFMMISRFIKYKGIENYIYLAKYIKDRYQNIDFILVGKKQKNFSLEKKIIDKKKLKKYIKLVNWQKKTNKLFSKCSVFVLPSKREGMSRSILEAMSSGKPIITTNVPGCKETVKNNVNGFTVNYDDNISLCNVAEKFVIKPELIKKFGKNSRKIAVKYFNVSKINSEIEKIIDSKVY